MKHTDLFLHIPQARGTILSCQWNLKEANIFLNRSIFFVPLNWHQLVSQVAQVKVFIPIKWGYSSKKGFKARFCVHFSVFQEQFNSNSQTTEGTVYLFILQMQPHRALKFVASLTSEQLDEKDVWDLISLMQVLLCLQFNHPGLRGKQRWFCPSQIKSLCLLYSVQADRCL